MPRKQKPHHPKDLIQNFDWNDKRAGHDNYHSINLAFKCYAINILSLELITNK